ncbi:capsid protein [Pineapple vitivirus A]|uniref:Capsid protein n=1 Tax=Pineapple vitivirus A TaxID=2967992 RepID=A0AAE9N5S7_9VIRU|nr:capsid protein [Pineapple vitivirus A]
MEKEMREGILTFLKEKFKDGFTDDVKTKETLREIFGNLAIVGTSKKADTSIKIIVSGSQVDLDNVVTGFMALSAASTSKPLKKATLRQIAEPFAQEAMEYLLEQASEGVYSNLAKKITRLGNREPHVCFDFSRGLDIAKLTPSEANVVQSLHARLFRTEGAKNVFAAQASVGDNAVEI